ncbi:tRNA methyltransferase complex GCD14 subunit [Meira miltonrushii]|uniref:tRNA (adenine(58)-N(1))-methyltransferase catalytic subunit TRM61 n=1 Tax=Meira miltonrushii TaxID=1280837 RepID=A0A316VKQ2_9BASI|nr:tRNA methyltransferase complex GCD14 subunit [Meira miltonrushii]PWN37834.1 tRNA methyltransferase complex GCD14 subunit [Meira miltonrushii]
MQAAGQETLQNDQIAPSTQTAEKGTGQNGHSHDQVISKPPYTKTNVISEGDLVIIFLSRDRPPIPLTVTSGQELTNTYGSFPHDEMIGKPFGARLASKNKRGFIHILRPTPELWTLALPHRTQILYTPDMSFISAHLGLSPGARMIESGTGSGSFSHYATRCVARKHIQSSGYGWKGVAKTEKDRSNRKKRKKTEDEFDDERQEGAEEDEEEEETIMQPSDAQEADILERLSAPPNAYVAPREGRVWSFEFHAGRAVKAWHEFEQHGLFPTLSLRHRNVVKNGFGLEGVADAVFLDLPAPWDAIPHAAEAMRKDVPTRICCFSPCVEQVLKTVAALRKAKWTDIETYECLNRTHLSIWCGPGAQNYTPSIDEAVERIREVEVKKGKRRDMQIQRARKERQERIQKEGDENDAGKAETTSELKVEKVRPEEENAETEEDAETNGKEGATDPSTPQAKEDGKSLQRANVLSRPFTDMRGHTSYLTFATLLPRIVERQPDPTLEREKENEKRKQLNKERAQKRKQASLEEA